MIPLLLVHGGAGACAPDDDEQAAMAGCLRAAEQGYAVLLQGGSALDAVEAATLALEDDPHFNAGLGACLDARGEVSLDASVMDGEGLRFGGVACVRTVRHPVRLARAVMEETPHALLAGAGAEAFARERGMEPSDPVSLLTPRSKARWERWVQGQAAPSKEGGTVGAVALDAQGRVAAATSTGGMIGKRPGRVGDTPLCGAGTYADGEAGAASATGHGEAILRVCLTRAVIDLIRAGRPAQEAVEHGLYCLTRVNGEAGLIAVDRRGNLGIAFNTERMARAWIQGPGRAGAAFHR
jgi:beta-aspartyl-peptidase (threonine type)